MSLFIYFCFVYFFTVRSEALSGRDSLGRPSIEQISLNTAFLDLSTVG